MKTQTRNILLISTLVFGIPGTSLFAEQQVFGYQLMTEQERIEHRAKMRSFKSAEERERYRLEHHKKMQERAKQQGVTLPDEPYMRGGPGPGKCGGGPGPGKCGGQGGR